MAKKVFDHFELPYREVERLAAPCHLAGRQIHRQVRLLESQDVIRAAAAQERTDPRQELGKGKRLDEIVVRAEIETLDAVVDGVLRRQDQHGRLKPALAKCGKNLQAAPPRQHEVEHHEIEGLMVGEEESFLARGRHVHFVAFGLEPFAKSLGNLSLVLHDQHPHSGQGYRGLPSTAPDKNVRNSSVATPSSGVMINGMDWRVVLARLD